MRGEGRSRGRAALAALAALVLLAVVAAAQNPPPPPPPPPQRPPAPPSPPAPAQSAGNHGGLPLPSADSFARELPPLGAPPGPLPRGSRMVYDRTDLTMSGALTLGELLTRVPGVFLVRAGWFALPEVAAYAGQGASSVELYWDGYPLDPLGVDSAGWDVGQVPLGLLRRVEIEVQPDVLRVYLFSDTQPVRRARTETSFASGDAQTNSYRIRYLNRWRGGLGFGLAADFLGTQGAPRTTGAARQLALWAKGTWAPSERVGFEYQLLRWTLERDPLTASETGTMRLLPGRDVSRTDAVFRASVGAGGSAGGGMVEGGDRGLRLDLIAGRSSYAGDSVVGNPAISQGALILGYRAATWSTEVTARARDVRTPRELGLRVAASPLAPLTLAAWGSWRDHGAGRRSTESGLALALRPVRFAQLEGALRWRDAVAVPALPPARDSAQRTAAWSLGARLMSPALDLQVAVGRRDSFRAPPAGEFAAILPLQPSPEITTVTTAAALRPRPWLTLSGWYRTPLGSERAAFEPPHHGRVWVTLRSRFLPSMRSGAFELVAEGALESWSRGIAGADSLGVPIALAGKAVTDWLLEIRLVRAVLFWTLRNSGLVRYQLVPGLPMPRSLSRFGVRWEFLN